MYIVGRLSLPSLRLKSFRIVQEVRQLAML
jgi:hypothetical protein